MSAEALAVGLGSRAAPPPPDTVGAGLATWVDRLMQPVRPLDPGPSSGEAPPAAAECSLRRTLFGAD